jgi:lipoprotein-releasing system permease protein
MSFAHISLAFRLLVGTGWRRQRLLFLLEVGVVSLAVLGAILTLVLSHSFERAITEKLYNYLGAFWVRSFAQEVESEPRPLTRPSLNIESSFGARVVGAVHLPVLMESAQAPYEGVQLLAVEGAWFEGMWRSALQKPLPAWQGHVAVLSERLAQRLQVKVGDEVIIAWLSDPPRFRKLKVIALYHSGLEEIDARIAFVPLEVGQALRRYAPDQVQVLHVFLASLSDFGAVLEALQENLSIDEEIVPIDYLFRDIFDWLGLIRQNVSLILSIVVGLSFFVAVSAFLVLMLTARVRFQVLRSLGMSRRGSVGVSGGAGYWGSRHRGRDRQLVSRRPPIFAGQMGMGTIRPRKLSLRESAGVLGRAAFCICGYRGGVIGDFDGGVGGAQCFGG